MGVLKPSSTLVEKHQYWHAHEWIKKNKPLPEFCERCNKKRKLDYANLSGNCLLDVNDWKAWCKRCHSAYDNPNGALDTRMRRSEQYVFDFIEEHVDDVRHYLRTNKKRWRLNKKVNAEIVIEYVTTDMTYKQVGLMHNLSTERIRQIIKMGIRVLSRSYGLNHLAKI